MLKRPLRDEGGEEKRARREERVGIPDVCWPGRLGDIYIYIYI